MRWIDALCVGMGSGLGGVARWGLAGLIQARIERLGRSEPALPWGILAVNVAGCFLLGLLMGILRARSGQPGSLWPGWPLLLGTGFLGGFTTFSTLLYDTWRLGPKWGLANLAVSALAGWLAVALGSRLASAWAP